MIEFRDRATKEAMNRLASYRNIMTRQEYSTIKGQIIAGDIDAALKGINTIAKRMEA